MNQLLLERSTGSLAQDTFARLYTSQRYNAIQHAPNLRFDGGEHLVPSHRDESEEDVRSSAKIWAHPAGLNALIVDPFEGRLLLSGGADSAVKLWNLEQITTGAETQTLRPVGSVSKTTSNAHSFGITALGFFPFDAQAFLSSSYDHSVKVYSTETLQVSASFGLNAIIYTHAMSPIASHLLVACATQSPMVRLVDLRTGSSAHSLPGHSGAVISVVWSPQQEFVLASGGADGTVRLWDVRKSASTLAMFDLEDSVGQKDSLKVEPGRIRESAKAHSAAVNGMSWTDDGSHIVTAGHDNRVRVWNATSRANTLASFGPTLKNSHLSCLPLLTTPTANTQAKKDLLFYPNENDILAFELHEGRLTKRMKTPGPLTAAVRSRTGERNIKNRVTAMSWRGVSEGLFSGHSDGNIRAWMPKTREDELGDLEDADEAKGRGEDDDATRKRKVLDAVYRDLTRQKITFG